LAFFIWRCSLPSRFSLFFSKWKAPVRFSSLIFFFPFGKPGMSVLQSNLKRGPDFLSLPASRPASSAAPACRLPGFRDSSISNSVSRSCSFGFVSSCSLFGVTLVSPQIYAPLICSLLPLPPPPTIYGVFFPFLVFNPP